MPGTRIHLSNACARFSLMSAERGRWFVVAWCVIGLAVIPACPAAEFVFSGLTRDNRPVSGHLAGDAPQNLRFIQNDGQALTLDQIQFLDLPIKPRKLPSPAWKRAKLVNGDILHAALANPGPAAAKSAPPMWATGFSKDADLPLFGIATLTHPPGTRLLVSDDFEETSHGWKDATDMVVAPSRGQARSGSASLKCGPETPALKYQLPSSFAAGRVEFHFYADPVVEQGGYCRCHLQFSGARPFVFSVDLVGQESWYETQTPSEGTWQRQAVPRRGGWHVVEATWSTESIRLAIDGFEAAGCRLRGDQSTSLSTVEFQSTQKSGAVWIDDFAISEAQTVPVAPPLQRDADQIDLATGDQLFGQLIKLDARAIHLSVNMQATSVSWGSVTDLHLATQPANSRAVTGWMTAIDLQPWSIAPELKDADSVRVALISITPDGCVVDHPICGRLTIPWSAIRRLRPSYRGQEWVLEGRPRHMGNEIKSAFAYPTNEGQQFEWQAEIPSVPDGKAFLRLSVADLEPAGAGTRAHRWLKQLRDGNLNSNLWVNQKRVAVLNQLITGRASPDRPQYLRFPIPDKLLSAGRNRVSIQLTPGAGDFAEYDDWELRELRLEIELAP